MTKVRSVVVPVAVAAGVGFGGVTLLTFPQTALSTVARLLGPAVGCNIKGNISISSREHIYHVPGQRYYNETVISPAKGERWFCSEVEAREAGWRRSRV